MKFQDFVCFEASVFELQAQDRDGAIAELVGSLVKAGRIGKSKQDDLVAALVERESEASTGLGKGVAIPHVKHKSVKKLVAAVGKCENGVDFAALDKQPVHLIIVMLSPADDPDKHLQAMEHLFKHIQNERFRRFLRQVGTVDQIEDLLRDADEGSLIT